MRMTGSELNSSMRGLMYASLYVISRRCLVLSRKIAKKTIPSTQKGLFVDGRLFFTLLSTKEGSFVDAAKVGI